MPTKPAFMLATTVVGAATICAIAGCSSPNSGVGSAGVSMIAAPPATSGSGTTTSTTTPATAFGAPTPYPNAQPFAAANSALVVYVPDNPNPGTPSPQLVVSPASGYAFNITYGTRDNRPAASVSLNANIPNVRSIDTARLDQPLKQQYISSTYAGYDGNWSYLDIHRPADSNNNPILTDAYIGTMYLNSSTSEAARVLFHGGAATPISQMPTTASATYDGRFVGVESRGNNALNIPYSAPMRMTANFGAGTLSGTVDQGPYSQFSLKFDGTISGNAYQGTAAMVSAPGQTTSNSGALNGAFYGTNASQTAGALAVQGTQNFGTGNTASPVTVYGTFGAKR